MTRKLVLGAAVLAFTGAVAFQALAQDSFQQHVDRAIAKTREIDKLIDGIGSRQTAGGGARVQTAAAVQTLKCAACGMEMSTKRANRRQREVKIKGKTYYCCAGCDMSKIVDK